MQHEVSVYMQIPMSVGDVPDTIRGDLLSSRHEQGYRELLRDDAYRGDTHDDVVGNDVAQQRLPHRLFGPGYGLSP